MWKRPRRLEVSPLISGEVGRGWEMSIYRPIVFLYEYKDGTVIPLDPGNGHGATFWPTSRDWIQVGRGMASVPRDDSEKGWKRIQSESLPPESHLRADGIYPKGANGKFKVVDRNSVDQKKGKQLEWRCSR